MMMLAPTEAETGKVEKSRKQTDKEYDMWTLSRLTALLTLLLTY